MSRRWRGMGRGLCVVLLLLGACGPVTYVRTVVWTGQQKVDAAAEAGADVYAPYWFTLAVEYLRAARREGARAEYQVARRYGKQAIRAAERAKTIALETAVRAGSSDGASKNR